MPESRESVRGVSASTLQDVAREAGVSLATASRVLNGSTRTVAEHYQARVKAAADRLGYTANLSAQATARGTTEMIALLVADIADPYFGQIAAGVARGADEAGLVVTIATTDRDVDREARLLHTLRGQRPRGVILAASRTAHSADPVLAAEITAIAGFGGRVAILGPGPEGIRSVVVDNRGGARALGRAVAERGYRHAVVLAAAPGVSTSDERLAGFRDGFGASGGAIDAVHRGEFTRESGAALAEAALADGVAPGTLVFAISDVMAIGALSALRAAGRGIGDDVALAGFDDIPTSQDVSPSLSTVHIPLEEVGYRAVRACIDDQWHPADPLAVEVILRESTPPRRP